MMDRGGGGSAAATTAVVEPHSYKRVLGQSCRSVDIRQTYRGWLQQMMCGCEARNEFLYYSGRGGGAPVAHSLEESPCCTRVLCQPCYAWSMPIRDARTRQEIFTVRRPWSCPAGPFKVFGPHCCGCGCYCGCCRQSATVTSRGRYLGQVRENCYCCVPSFSTYDENGAHTYTIHPPTCCCGTCINPCAESCLCCCLPPYCCRVPFWIFPAHQWMTDGPMADFAGTIVKKPKNYLAEVFTDANAFEVEFPAGATPEEKAVLVGTSIFFNSLFFEETPVQETDRIDSSAATIDPAYFLECR